MGVVTVSAAYGAAGAEVSRAVAERLGLPFHDRAIAAQVAGRLGVPVSEAEANDETVVRGLWRLVASLGTMPDPVGGVLPDVVPARCAGLPPADRAGAGRDRRRGRGRRARPRRARSCWGIGWTRCTCGWTARGSSGSRRPSPARARSRDEVIREMEANDRTPGGLRAALLPVRPGVGAALPPGHRHHGAAGGDGRRARGDGGARAGDHLALTAFVSSRRRHSSEGDGRARRRPGEWCVQTRRGPDDRPTEHWVTGIEAFLAARSAPVQVRFTHGRTSHRRFRDLDSLATSEVTGPVHGVRLDGAGRRSRTTLTTSGAREKPRRSTTSGVHPGLPGHADRQVRRARPCRRGCTRCTR